MRSLVSFCKKLLKLFLLFILPIIFILEGCTKSTEKAAPEILTVNQKNYVDPPDVRSYPSSEATVNGWIYSLDHSKIRAHAWDIWESITTKTSLGLPVWETWYSGYELFDLSNKRTQRNIIHDFQMPKQFLHASAHAHIPDDPSEIPISFNRYTQSLADVIWEKGYNKISVMDSINNSFTKNNTPPIDRQIITSVDSIDVRSFALKPVFQFIRGDTITAFPYWAGISTQSSTDLDNPEPHTWRQCVVIDPTGKLKPGTTYKISCNGEPPQEWPVVSLDDFYHIKITKEEAKNFSQFAATSGDDVGQGDSTATNNVLALVKEGNYALLTAMHVTGKEITNWTWQTFWWSYHPDDVLFGKDRPKTIEAPWSNYNMRTAYYMVAPPGTKEQGEPLISFNPYLETNLSGKVPYETIPGDSISWTGPFTNCMSCHRMAAYPNSLYYPSGFIDPASTYKFSKNTKTDFLWSVAIRPK
jgi:hypothetical protein